MKTKVLYDGDNGCLEVRLSDRHGMVGAGDYDLLAKEVKRHCNGIGSANSVGKDMYVTENGLETEDFIEALVDETGYEGDGLYPTVAYRCFPPYNGFGWRADGTPYRIATHSSSSTLEDAARQATRHPHGFEVLRAYPEWTAFLGHVASHYAKSVPPLPPMPEPKSGKQSSYE